MSQFKSIRWVGSSLADLRGFPDDARRRAGFELDKVQQGLEPSDWKWFPGIGAGVVELRIHTTVEHRVIYIAKFAEGIYVLHAFEKRSQQTCQMDVELAQSRLRQVLRERVACQRTKIRSRI